MLLYYWIYLTCWEKEIKCSASLAFYLFSPTRLINSIKHEHSCKILYIKCFKAVINPFKPNGISHSFQLDQPISIFIPRHTLVSGYYVIPFGVCPSVRPSVRAHHFRSITWVFIHRIFSNFAYILLSAMSGMGLLMGKIRPFLMELLPFFVLEKWFLACYSFTVHDIWMKLHRYVAHQKLHIVTKDRHSDLPSLWVIRPW